MKNYRINTEKKKTFGSWYFLGYVLDDGNEHAVMRNELNGKYYIDLNNFGSVDIALLPESAPKDAATELIQACPL